DEFSRIARDIVNAIPSLKIFKEKNLLDNLRKELQEIHQTKYELKIIPKFDTEFSQNTNEDLVPASKKHCSFEEMEEVDPNIPPETEKVMIITANQYEEKPPSIKRITEQETHFTAHHAHIHQQQLDFNQQILPSVFPEPMEVTSQETNSRPQFFFTNEQLNSHEPINTNFFAQRQTTSSLEEERRNYTDKWTASTLLQQPISSLRCNRRRSSRQTFEETDSNRSQTDLLDFIDNIPIDDLERKLLNRGSVHEQRAVALSPPGRLPATVSRHHIASLERPKVGSPSPPKMYRMNMF
uniref:Uncharacterized protein n=2 Tax=Clytia hemisphaerica TaxID=252671 RepID=A0A7M5XEB8_9CNID